ncbi:ADL347Cp [Eremothecium gossypii ATCC 10895]|uniref:Transcription initiation factor TFIID subunit 13 n=1 Tax=Eremothecium gossypii (strain ATCC 10895 / CBS 109.51 / FGSC 9923 / NRRL Y-1056) TaxID=284811 RepID=Q75BB4_EREGS|nr:ADL347Cp [Eremothecium gossypii ATCC 10895]AAS51572.1 ADL347Cp [Eremothecium gossypii ATCC 10895]AEY95869.1 FADL347Cp [Eremothecium gossypii FDAG1]
MSRKLKKTNLFSKDVAPLMYAYGDSPQPLPETVQCVDELVTSYLTDICANAYRCAQTVHRTKIKVEDFKFVLRNDPVNLGRAEELIMMNKVIADARKQFDNSEGKSLKRVNKDEDLEDIPEEDGEDMGGMGPGSELAVEETSKRGRKPKKRKNAKGSV